MAHSPDQAGERKAKGRKDSESSTITLQVKNVRLDHIDQGPQLIRHDQDDEEITELAAHIAQHGLLQPIGVYPISSGRFQLLYGARRCLAATRLRWSEIPAHIHEHAAGSIPGLAAAENLMRRQLTLQEECDAVARLHHEENRSPQEIALLVGKSRAWVMRRLAVPQLPDDLREHLLAEHISLGVAETLSQITDPSLRAYAINQARVSALSVADCRAMVAGLSAAPNLAEAIQAGEAEAQTPQQAQALFMECAACRTPRPLAQLTVIRVCSTGCPTEHASPESNGDDHGR